MDAAPSPEAAALLARLRAFALPRGEESLRGARGVRLTQRGEGLMDQQDVHG